MVSSRLLFAGETVAIMQVFVRPPRESCKSRVSFESLTENQDAQSAVES